MPQTPQAHRPDSSDKPGKSKEIERPPMVGWCDPSQLVRTGLLLVVSSIFGRHSDKRHLQVLSDSGTLKKRHYYEVIGRDEEEFWFDYISDVGDGFDSTYTMAYHLTRQNLSLAETKSTSPVHQTQRGEIVVFGGDEIYPYASFKNYKDRLIEPYHAAFPGKEKDVERPAAFAIPGNHDWYDSLVSFSRIFCQQKRFVGWETKQNRSYFAIKLPRGWWLFGTDMQLASTLDNAQMEYFKRVMTFVGDGDRIILCNAEPHWITDKMYLGNEAYNNRNMGFFDGHILKEKAVVHIAGDRHYYRHHEFVARIESDKGVKNRVPLAVDDEVKHKIVAGGGAAFLHPTHNEGVDEIGREHIYALRASFPSEQKSFWLTFWNLLFPIWNWKFGIITGPLYLLTAQAFFAGRDLSSPSALDSIWDVPLMILGQPAALFWTVFIVLGFIFFTEPQSTRFRLIAGPFHAICHLAAVVLLGWAIWTLVIDGYSDGFSLAWRLFISGTTMIITGGLVGSAIMGLYVLVSLNVFKKHHNEAFTAIKCADYKNFLRLRISTDGDLTIFPVGVTKVNRSWTKYNERKTPHIEPAVPEKMERPHLIEPPIVCPGQAGEYGSDMSGVPFAVVPREMDPE